MAITVHIKYNDGQWRSQKYPIGHTQDETKQAIELFEQLTKFKDLTYIQDFKVTMIKYGRNFTPFAIDIADLIQQTNE